MALIGGAHLFVAEREKRGGGEGWGEACRPLGRVGLRRREKKEGQGERLGRAGGREREREIKNLTLGCYTWLVVGIEDGIQSMTGAGKIGIEERILMSRIEIPFRG